MTTTDQETGKQDGFEGEPLATLRKFRSGKDNAVFMGMVCTKVLNYLPLMCMKVLLLQNVISEKVSSVLPRIKVGDRITVLEEAVIGPF